jgi:glycosyltransferase involved in cell wall biosynthesis
MRILIHGRFYPSVGGIETVISLLAREWAAAGHEPTVVSNLPGPPASGSSFPFRAVYAPGASAWWHLVKSAEVVLHLNISLKALWPHFLLRRPLIISHQSCYKSYRSYSSYSRSWRERLKLCCISGATNVAASRAIAHALGISCKVIPNPYDSAVFIQPTTLSPDRDLIFVGRLVSEKGVDLLLTGMKYLQPPWNTARLTIIGDGPQRASLQSQTTKSGLAPRVNFLGTLDPHGVARELRRHKILVIPSLYEEPFGVVALEGASSGCLVLGSDGGGLPEAIGPAGTLFRRGDPVDLASQLMRLLQVDSELPWQRQAAIADHLKRHYPAQIASEYLKIFYRLKPKCRKAELREALIPRPINSTLFHSPVSSGPRGARPSEIYRSRPSQN